MQGRRALLCLSLVAVLIGIGTPGMVREVDAGIPISSCGPIMETGSYELTQGLASNGDCLVVQAEFVTIDLKGFAISGYGSGTAINVLWGRGLTVRDGTIYNFNAGIRAGQGVVVERVRFVWNDVGVEALGYGPTGSTVVKDSVFESNRQYGVWISSGTVTGSVFKENMVGGISVDAGGTIANNTLSYNSIGIETRGPGASIQSNTVINSWNVGVTVACPANIIGNTVTGGWSPFNVQGQVWECNFEHNLVGRGGP